MDKKKAPCREQTTIRLPIELKEQLREEANKKGMDFNSFVLMVFHQYVEHE